MGKYSNVRKKANQFKKEKWKIDKLKKSINLSEENNIEVNTLDHNSEWKEEYNNYLLNPEKKCKEANSLLLKYKPKNPYKYLSLEKNDSGKSYAIKNSVLIF